MKDNQKRRYIILIIILSVIALLAICVAVWSFFFRPAALQQADFQPRPIDPQAKPIEEGYTSKAAESNGAGSVSMSYSTQVDIYLDEKEAGLFFQNPSRSNRDILLQIYAGDKLIGESGRVRPGYMLDRASLFDLGDLAAGTYEGKFLVTYYDPVTHDKALITTEIPITLTVYNGK